MATPLAFTAPAASKAAMPAPPPVSQSRADLMAYLLDSSAGDDLIARPAQSVGEGAARAAGMGLDAFMANKVGQRERANTAARNTALADALFPTGEGGQPDPKREMVAQLLETGAVDPSVFGPTIARNMGFGEPAKPTIQEGYTEDGRKTYFQVWPDGRREQFGGAEALPADKRPTPYTDPAKINADEQSGFLSPEDAAAARQQLAAGAKPGFSDVGQLRKEIQALPSYKNVSQALPIYRSMIATAPNKTRASDLNLVYGLGKIFDPGSVVREGEMVLVQDTASLPDQLVGAINRLNGGQALQEDTRNAILAEARTRMDAYLQAWDGDASQYRGIAERNGLDLADVIPDIGEVPEFKPLGAGGTGAGEVPKIASDDEYDALPSGAEYLAPDGSLRRKQ